MVIVTVKAGELIVTQDTGRGQDRTNSVTYIERIGVKIREGFSQNQSFFSFSASRNEHSYGAV